MKITEEELAAKRARAAHLRGEIRSLQAEDVVTRREREMVVEAEQLDAEIASLEVKVVDAARASGGTVEDAKAAMERAAELERMMLPSKEDSSDEKKDDKSEEKSDETKKEETSEPKADTPPDAGEIAEKSADVPAPAGKKAGGSN